MVTRILTLSWLLFCTTVLACPHYLQIANSPIAEFNGYYEHDGYDDRPSSKPIYKHIDNDAYIRRRGVRWTITRSTSSNDDCCYRGKELRFFDGRGFNFDAINCPSELNGDTRWEYNTGLGGRRKLFFGSLVKWLDWRKQFEQFSPALQIQGLDVLPVRWGNAVGYWSYISSGSGSSGGASRSWTTSFTDSSTESRTYTLSEQLLFTRTGTFTSTPGVEIGFKQEAGFGLATASAEERFAFTASLSSTRSRTSAIATANALLHSQSTSNSQSQTCTSTAPVHVLRPQDSTSWTLHAWQVYRASNIENVGATRTTCEFQYMTGPCRFVPPNCPLGTCLDEHCIQCVSTMSPFKTLLELTLEYPGCIDSLDIQAEVPRCSLQSYDWNCCTTDSPCGLNQGDCDEDSHCEGELVCDHSFCGSNSDCPHGSFDVCVMPARRQLRRLLEIGEKDDEHAEGYEKSLSEDPREVRSHKQGCKQFVDEGHCSAGPLYKYCRWLNDRCVTKKTLKDEDVPEGDFSFVYDKDWFTSMQN